jgi:hypothetical protein
MRTDVPLLPFGMLTIILLCLSLAGSLSCTTGMRREAAPGSGATPADSAAVKAIFANPPREYASAPLWVWNDMLTDEEVVGTLRDLASQGVKQAFVHPRPGLMTPYLSEEWFRLWKVALGEAERLDMNLWIYDENSYPSGFAGGWVPQEMPESRGRGLVAKEEKRAPKLEAATVAVYRLTGSGYENVTDKLRGGEKLPDATYLTYAVTRTKDSPWTASRCYVDLMYPGVTEKFLAVTMEPYRRHIGNQFGKRVPGVFTDEPNIQPAGGLPWTDDLPQVFEKRWGYSLTDNLPALSRPVGDWKRVRHNYVQVLNDLFIERWGKPYHDYCEKHNLEFTGHYWEHEWPDCFRTPDCMAMYAWHQRPAIDILMNDYSEDVHAQFGNLRAVKELSSVANQLGRKRTLCEAYGAGGWDLRFEDMKRIGDWLYVLGVNTLDQHLSYISMRGARKHDHPQSFSYQEPWWEAYHVSANYFARLSAAMSAGEEINPVLVLEPTTTAWMYNSGGGNDPQLSKIGAAFQKLVTDLSKAQVEYDIGSEDIIARYGSADGKTLRIGRRQYGIVVLPPLTENVNSRTMDLFEAYAKAGGNVFCCGEPPTLVDGKASDRGAMAVKGWLGANAADLASYLLMAMMEEPRFVGVRRAENDKGILFHHRRQLRDGDLVFLVNTSIESPVTGTVEGRAGGVEQWDINTGKASAYPFDRPLEGAIRASFELPPSGSLLLFLSKEKRQPTPAVAEKLATIKPVGEPTIKRIAPNVLTVDYMDVTAGGETRANSYFYPANQFAFQKNGMERNPWDSAVQYKDEIITKKFPADSGVEATYRFRIEEKVPANLAIVIERPDLYTITCNGKPVSAKKGDWWLDKSFGRIDIASAAQVGENLVTIKASPFTIYHELESAYVLGDFSLKAANRGFVIVPDQGLKLGKWNEQGHPFYAQGVRYTQTFHLEPASVLLKDKKGQEKEIHRLPGRYRVSLPAWYGSVAKVVANGKPAGYVSCPPWECDVTDQLKVGENTIEVTVIGTLKNTLGPHHGKPALGKAWPAAFHVGPNPGPPPGSEYSVVGYGLFEPFVLKQAAR